MHNLNKIILAALAVAVAGGLVIAAAASTTHAQEPTPTPTSGAHGARRAFVAGFMERLASNLGVTRDELRAAMKQAALDTIDDLAASGQITQQQADRAKARIESGNTEGLGIGRMLSHRDALRARVVRGIVHSAADALGMEPKDLAAELRAGTSIADVAAERGVSLDAVKAAITADAKTRLDALVARGRITQEREDQLLEALASRLDTALQRSRPAPTPAP